MRKKKQERKKDKEDEEQKERKTGKKKREKQEKVEGKMKKKRRKHLSTEGRKYVVSEMGPQQFRSGQCSSCYLKLNIFEKLSRGIYDLIDGKIDTAMQREVALNAACSLLA